MQVELSGQDIQSLLESLRYSKAQVSGITNPNPAPKEVAIENLRRLEEVEAKLRQALKQDGRGSPIGGRA